VVAVDLSRFGLEVAGKKAAKVTSQNSQRFTSIEANFLEADLKGIRFDGAIMNNVFYTMSPTQRKQALAKIFKALNSGGRFFLSDPLPKVQNAAAELEDFVKLAMVDAARQGAPLTEFDIAFAGGMNVFFMRKSPQFMSTKELIAEAQAAGFRVLDWEIGYYGQVSSLELEKP
jgi:ubiquinone/menaquinone biosynthesis C-methylase UbiE